MVFSDRATILVGGPVTAVASFRASAAERASAYAPHDAAGVIDRVLRDPGGGDYQGLVDMFQLWDDVGSTLPWKFQSDGATFGIPVPRAPSDRSYRLGGVACPDAHG